jgi:hypothetical protein
VINAQFRLQQTLGVTTGPADGVVVTFTIVDRTAQIAGFYHGFVKQGLPPFLVGGRTGSVTVSVTTLLNGIEQFPAVPLTNLTSTSVCNWSFVCFTDGCT